MVDKLPHIHDGDMIKVRFPNANRDGLRGPVKLKRSLRDMPLVMVPSLWHRNRNSARMISIPLAYIVAAIHEGVEMDFEQEETRRKEALATIANIANQAGQYD